MDCSSNVADENDDECAMIYPVADEVLIRRLFIDNEVHKRGERKDIYNYQTQVLGTAWAGCVVCLRRQLAVGSLVRA